MKIAIVGTGYVGLVSGACFAEMGFEVVCIDLDTSKIDNIRKGVMPIYEPGLADIVKRNIELGRLRFTTSLAAVIDGVDVAFVAVGTPPSEDGSADVSRVLEVAREFGRLVSKYTLLVVKSTVPVGTCAAVQAAVQAELDRRGAEVEFDVASNPEFLKEGDAIRDFMSPDRVVVGVDSDRAQQLMTQIYTPFLINNFRVIFMDVASAEMTKYASNAMLATRISFMNDIANLCEVLGADVNAVRKGIGSDTRIGNKFLYAGCGYGGSCFPKDVKALVKSAEQQGYEMRVLRAVDEVNERQKGVMFEKLSAYFEGELSGRRVALWGLSFKPETDDMREAPSLVVIERLLAAECSVVVYDPVAMEECRRRFGDSVEYATDMYSATEGADALMLLTEWKSFRVVSWSEVRARMSGRLILDGRNIYSSTDLINLGFDYHGIGK